MTHAHPQPAPSGDLPDAAPHNSENLLALQQGIEKRARELGLDFDPVIFEVVTSRELNSVAAREGYPVRYPHWRWGMEFERLQKGYDFGASKIYELVINNNPVYAYLLGSNSLMEQKMVMAHVYGHADFFKNNLFFENSERKMLDQMGNHAARIKQYMAQYGETVVEEWIDLCRSLENLIGPAPGPIRRDPPDPSAVPEQDVLRLLIERAVLEDWQRDVLSIVRAEAHYFLPQARTKIMNEGWAAYWHSKMMTEELALGSEIVDYCETHASGVAKHPKGINPYQLGLAIFRDIAAHHENGIQKIFDVRRTHNDVTFIDEFLTRELAERDGIIEYERSRLKRRSKEEIFNQFKTELLQGLSNRGEPRFTVIDHNFNGNGDLYLRHEDDGQELDQGKATATMANLVKLWGKGVHVETSLEGKRVVINHYGFFHTQRPLQ